MAKCELDPDCALENEHETPCAVISRNHIMGFTALLVLRTRWATRPLPPHVVRRRLRAAPPSGRAQQVLVPAADRDPAAVEVLEQRL